MKHLSVMKQLLAVAVTASTILAAGAARADWTIGAGFESFRWKESTSPSVEEKGLRYSLNLTWAQSKAPGLSAGYHIKFYNGNVDYDGATLFGGVPISAETHYRGLVNEVQAWYRMQNNFDILLAFGWDHWDRTFKATAQEETWEVVYGKLGVAWNMAVKQGFYATAGIKYPVYTRENGNFADLGATGNPRLKPGKELSLYGSLAYRVNPSWDVIAYYDSYRFKESNTVNVPFPGFVAGFFQPKSRMDVFGMSVNYNF